MANPDPPVDFSGTLNFDNAIISWYPPAYTGDSPISFYDIYDETETLLGTSTTASFTNTNTNFTLTSTYLVRVINENGNQSVLSNPYVISRMEYVNDMSGQWINNNTQVIFNWTAPTPTGGFPISFYRLVVDGTTISDQIPGTNTSYTITTSYNTLYASRLSYVNTNNQYSLYTFSPNVTNYTTSDGGATLIFNDGVTEIIRNDVVSVPAYNQVTTVVIPTSVVTICGTYIQGDLVNPTIDTGAFSNLDSLTTVTINTPSALEIIGGGAFYNTDSLTSINLPSGLRYIGSYAFESSNISSINLSEGLEYIGSWAFGTVNATVNTIPSTVTYLGEFAFAGTFIMNITFTNITTFLPALTGINLIAFRYCIFPTTLTIPSNIIDISGAAFSEANFSGGSGTDCGLILSEGLQIIEAGAFGGCTFSGNRSLIIPPSVEYIGDGAFFDSNLTNITYYATTVLGYDPFPAGAIINVITIIDPPINLLALDYPFSIVLTWTNVNNPEADNPYYVIENTNPPYDTYTTSITNTLFEVSGLSIGETRTYSIKIVDEFDFSSSVVTFNPATAIGKISVTITISGELVQTIPFIGTPIIPWTVLFTTISSPYDAPPYPNNPVSAPFFLYTASNGTILPSLPSDSGYYTVYAYIGSNDPYYTGTSATSTFLVVVALPQLLNCSPALELNALSKGGNFSSAITLALAKQMNNTTIAAKVLSQTSAPVCCSTGPIISPFSGGTTSGTQTQALIQNQALCTYNQNLAVAKLRQIPGCPIDNAQRFAKYQRFPSAEANCMPPVIVTGLPKALNGPCTNVIGISQTKPPS